MVKTKPTPPIIKHPHIIPRPGQNKSWRLIRHMKHPLHHIAIQPMKQQNRRQTLLLYHLANFARNPYQIQNIPILSCHPVLLKIKSILSNNLFHTFKSISRI